MNRTDLAEIHRALDGTVNLASFMLNGFLLYLIRYHSARGMRLYQRLLAIDVSFDFVLSIVAMEAQPVVLTGDGYFTYTCSGPFASLWRPLDAWTFLIYGVILHLNLTWIPTQFIYRYVLLCCRDTPRRARRISYTVAVIYALWNCAGYFAMSWLAHADNGIQEKGLHVLEINDWPTIDLYGREHIPVGAHITDAALDNWVAHWVFTCFASIIIVVVVELQIVRYLKLTDSSHDETRKMHKEFHRALLATAIVPLGTTTFPILYFMYHTFFRITSGPFGAFIGIFVSSITLFNPLTTIFFMRCYREALRRKLWCLRKARVSAEPTTNVAGLLSVATTVEASREANPEDVGMSAGDRTLSAR